MHASNSIIKFEDNTTVVGLIVNNVESFAITDWNMFRDSSDGIEEYTTSVTGIINKCIEDVVPTVTVRTYSNHKPWITGSIRTELKGRAAAFKEILLCLATNHQTGKVSIQD